MAACLIATPAPAADSVRWTEPLIVNGSSQPVVISPYRLTSSSASGTPENKYILYDVDYSDLSNKLRNYRIIYYSGQGVHGIVLLNLKPQYIKE